MNKNKKCSSICAVVDCDNSSSNKTSTHLSQCLMNPPRVPLAGPLKSCLFHTLLKQRSWGWSGCIVRGEDKHRPIQSGGENHGKQCRMETVVDFLFSSFSFYYLNAPVFFFTRHSVLGNIIDFLRHTSKNKQGSFHFG